MKNIMIRENITIKLYEMKLMHTPIHIIINCLMNNIITLFM